VPKIEYEGDKDRILSTRGVGETMNEVMRRRFSRRAAVAAGAAGAAGAAMTVGVKAQSPTASPAATPGASPAAGPESTVVGSSGSPVDEPTLSFENIGLKVTENVVVAEGYTAVPFLRWGDPITADAPELDLHNQTAAAQAVQAGYNCDYIGWISLPLGSNASDNGLLVVNHEYTNPEIMFPGYLTTNPDFDPADEESQPFVINTSKEIVDIELEAHGLSVVEVRRIDGQWEVVRDSQYNRRITATTPMQLTGPVAGSEVVMTADDAEGVNVVGTLNNCAGGTTPWGTVISGEENFHQYFANLDLLDEANPMKANHERYGITPGSSDRLWEEFYPRFDVSLEPNEPVRYGWAIEVDPFDPASTPKKRTAMGRNKHEGHTSVVSPSGHVVVYSGDDERFEYAYKFVTAGTYDAGNREANLNLLDEGTLYVAKYNDDGTGEWLPLTFGENGLDESNGFTSQVDVLINPRASADVLGATKMDRPEDFETNPVNKKVYLVCTNNTNRAVEDNAGTDAANPRAENSTGHIIEMTEDGNDHAATTFAWEIFLLAGDPADESTYFAGFPKEQVSPIASPDNITFDTVGNIWISTDGLPNSFEGYDGLFATPTEGSERGYLRQFFSTVEGAECSGPVFNPDGTALFLSVQHPGEGGVFGEQKSTWPDYDGAPKPSVVLIIRNDGGVIGQ
jgi:uncharacterized protein